MSTNKQSPRSVLLGIFICLCIVSGVAFGALSLKNWTASISQDPGARMGHPRSVDERPVRMRKQEKEFLREDSEEIEALGRKIEFLMAVDENLTFEEAKEQALQEMQAEVAIGADTLESK